MPEHKHTIQREQGQVSQESGLEKEHCAGKEFKMIGVRKDSGVIRLLMAAALVLFVAACSTTDNTAKRERDQAQMERDEAQMERDEAQMERDEAQMERDEAQQEVVNLSGSLEELRGQLAALQESGTDADQATIDALMAEIARLEEVEKEAMDAEAAAKKASILALFKGLDKRINPENAGGVADPTALVPPLARFDVGHTDGTAENNMRLSVNHGKATKVTPATAGTTSP